MQLFLGNSDYTYWLYRMLAKAADGKNFNTLFSKENTMTIEPNPPAVLEEKYPEETVKEPSLALQIQKVIEAKFTPVQASGKESAIDQRFFDKCKSCEPIVVKFFETEIQDLKNISSSFVKCNIAANKNIILTKIKKMLNDVREGFKKVFNEDYFNNSEIENDFKKKFLKIVEEIVEKKIKANPSEEEEIRKEFLSLSLEQLAEAWTFFVAQIVSINMLQIDFETLGDSIETTEEKIQEKKIEEEKLKDKDLELFASRSAELFRVVQTIFAKNNKWDLEIITPEQVTKAKDNASSKSFLELIRDFSLEKINELRTIAYTLSNSISTIVKTEEEKQIPFDASKSEEQPGSQSEASVADPFVPSADPTQPESPLPLEEKLEEGANKDSPKKVAPGQKTEEEKQIPFDASKSEEQPGSQSQASVANPFVSSAAPTQPESPLPFEEKLEEGANKDSPKKVPPGQKTEEEKQIPFDESKSEEQPGSQSEASVANPFVPSADPTQPESPPPVPVTGLKFNPPLEEKLEEETNKDSPKKVSPGEKIEEEKQIPLNHPKFEEKGEEAKPKTDSTQIPLVTPTATSHSASNSQVNDEKTTNPEKPPKKTIGATILRPVPLLLGTTGISAAGLWVTYQASLHLLLPTLVSSPLLVLLVCSAFVAMTLTLWKASVSKQHQAASMGTPSDQRATNSLFALFSPFGHRNPLRTTPTESP